MDVVDDPNVYEIKNKLNQKVEGFDSKATAWSNESLLTYEKLIKSNFQFNSFDEEAKYALKCFYTTYILE